MLEAAVELVEFLDGAQPRKVIVVGGRQIGIVAVPQSSAAVIALRMPEPLGRDPEVASQQS